MKTVSIALQTWDNEKKEVVTECILTFSGDEFDDNWYGKTFNVEKIEKNGDAINGDEFEELLGNRLTDYLDIIRERFGFAEFDYAHLTSRVVEPYTPCEFVE